MAVKRYRIRAYAELMGFKYKTVWLWVKANKVKHEKSPGGQIVILVEETEDNK